MSNCSDIQIIRAGLLGDHAVVALAETFRVLGDVTRVRILDAISRTELCVGDIAELLGLSESAVSHQLRVLRGMRLVQPRRAGQLIFYSLDDHHIIELFEEGLKHVQERGTAEIRPRNRSLDGVGRAHIESSSQQGSGARESREHE